MLETFAVTRQQGDPTIQCLNKAGFTVPEVKGFHFRRDLICSAQGTGRGPSCIGCCTGCCLPVLLLGVRQFGYVIQSRWRWAIRGRRAVSDVTAVVILRVDNRTVRAANACCGLFTLQDTDSAAESYSDSKSDGYFERWRACSHCTASDLDSD